MNITKAFSRRCLVWTLITMLLLTALIDVGLWLGVNLLSAVVPLSVLNEAAARTPALATGIEKVLPMLHTVKTFFLPVTVAIFILFSLLLWLILRRSMARLLKKAGIVDSADKKKTEEISKPGEEGDAVSRKKALNEQNRRYYLNLLSVLQREGRLVDFFQEDLSPYADEQIGAAVRSVHENCSKTIQKYLAPRSVIDRNEGETVTVPSDFDPGAIKLIGNVTGDPPFQGVLRHRGWRASKIELPVLSAAQDAAIIAPAEVEVQ